MATTTAETLTGATARTDRMAAPRVKSGWRKSIGPILKWVVIIVIGLAFAFPLYWTVTMSFKPLPEWNPPGQVFWVPENPTVSNYVEILGLKGEAGSGAGAVLAAERSAIGPLKNSAIAGIGGTLLALAVGIFAAYGIARFRSGGRILPFQILQLRMFPPVAIIIPLLFMWVYLGLYDTVWGLIIIYAAVTFPFVVWLMRSFFQETPREIAEAAIVDGCTQWGAFFRAMLPLAKGGLAATALFVFILNWSDFLIALSLTQNEVETAPVFLKSLQGGQAGQEYGRQAALAMILIIPPAVFGLMIHKYLVRGLTFGAIKQ